MLQEALLSSYSGLRKFLPMRQLPGRVSGTIAYSNIRGRYFYKVSEIRRMLEERLIRSNKENIDNLITNHQLYAKERGNLRKNK